MLKTLLTYRKSAGQSIRLFNLSPKSIDCFSGYAFSCLNVGFGAEWANSGLIMRCEKFSYRSLCAFTRAVGKQPSGPNPQSLCARILFTSAVVEYPDTKGSANALPPQECISAVSGSSSML